MRRTKEEARQTREEIIEVAANLFETLGFEMASMEKIASEAGVTRGAIYWHFANKAEVLESIISKEGERLGVLIKNALASSDSPLEKLQRLIFSVVDNFYDNKRFRQFIRITWYKLGTDLFEKILSEKAVFIQDFINLMQALLGEAKAANEVRPELDPVLEAYHLSCLINGFYRVYLVSSESGRDKNQTMKLFEAAFAQTKK